MEDIFGNRIVFAEEDKIQTYGVEMKRVLSAVAFFMADDPQEWLKKCWVSNESKIWDFGMSYEDIVKLADTLDVPVAQNDLLWKVAQRIHERVE